MFWSLQEVIVRGIVGRWEDAKGRRVGVGRKVFIDYRWGDRCRYQMRGGSRVIGDSFTLFTLCSACFFRDSHFSRGLAY